jgi:uncharacterized protein YecE (DUF72 family)
VEINNTFYREPVLQSFLEIERRSKETTRYVVKVYRDISHTKTWDKEAAKAMMEKHVTAASPLVESGRFFSFLIQLEDHLYKTRDRLDYLLSVASVAVAKRIDVHIEFRHGSWHDRFVLQSLKDNGVGICNTEIPPFKHVFPLKAYATTDKGYVRYSGRNLDNWYPEGSRGTAAERLAARNARYDYLYSDQEMAQRVEGQIILSTKTSSVAVAYNNHYETKAVKNAIQNMRLLEKRLAQRLNSERG